jgi:hypothetical protein
VFTAEQPPARIVRLLTYWAKLIVAVTRARACAPNPAPAQGVPARILRFAARGGREARFDHLRFSIISPQPTMDMLRLPHIGARVSGGNRRQRARPDAIGLCLGLNHGGAAGAAPLKRNVFSSFAMRE